MTSKSRKEGVAKRDAIEDNPDLELQPDSKKMKREPQVGVFSCGSGTFGQLAQGPKVLNSLLPSIVHGLPTDLKCIDIKCGSMHVIALMENGEIYSAGASENNANGRNPEKSQDLETNDSESEEYDEDEDYYFRKVEFNEKVVAVEAGHSFSAVLDSKGSVWIWGIFTDDQGQMRLKNGSSKIPKILTSDNCINAIVPDSVVKISSGNDHLLCLSRKGQVFSFGSTAVGQVGRFSKKQSEERAGRNGLAKLLTPHAIIAKGMDRFIEIFASTNNSTMKSFNGQLYSCGLNTFHQLAFESERDNVFSPTLASPIDLEGKKIDEEITTVSYGLNHAAFLTESGKIYTCGKLQSDLIGRKLENSDKFDEITSKLIEIKLPGNKKCKSLVCGPDCTAAVTDDGKCYTWGTNSYGNLCHEKRDPINEPTEINLGTSGMTKILKVSFGYTALFLLAEYEN